MSARILVGLISLLPLSLFADTTASVNVPDHCTVTDTDGVAHTYSGGYYAVCALETAIGNGSISGAQFSNAFPAFGLFVISVGGVSADQSSQYWALYQNGSFASLGLTQLSVVVGDSVTLELHDFSDTYLGTRFTLNITSLVSSQSAAPSSGGGVWMHGPFDVPLALRFLTTHQSVDGSFDSSLISDWASFALNVGGADDARAKLANFQRTSTPTLSSVTDYERHAMALEALGIDPYIGTPVDSIDPIVKSFDGTQFGSPSLINDDIFAFFPLLHAGYAASDPMLAQATNNILSKQRADGSWEGSVDLTAAAMQALSFETKVSGVYRALSGATSFLHAQQQKDGGFGNSFSTSWVIQGIVAQNDTAYDFAQGTADPLYYLATQQMADGGVGTDNLQTRLWATAYAVPAVTGHTWDSLLQSFSKPTPEQLEATSSSLSAVVAPANTTQPAQVPTIKSDDTSKGTTTALSQAAAVGAIGLDWNDVLLLLPFLAFLLVALFYFRKWQWF